MCILPPRPSVARALLQAPLPILLVTRWWTCQVLPWPRLALALVVLAVWGAGTASSTGLVPFNSPGPQSHVFGEACPPHPIVLLMPFTGNYCPEMCPCPLLNLLLENVGSRRPRAIWQAPSPRAKEGPDLPPAWNLWVGPELRWTGVLLEHLSHWLPSVVLRTDWRKGLADGALMRTGGCWWKAPGPAGGS